MNAGRELDALVAEKVMGWTWDETRCRVCGWTLTNDFDGCLPGNCSQRPRPINKADEPQRYSTDIAAAWQVVANLNARGWRVEIFSTARSGVDVQISKWGGPHHEGDYAEWAATAPHAICLAALRAVGAL